MGYRLWRIEAETHQTRLTTIDSQIAGGKETLALCRQQTDAAYQKYMQYGGGVIEQLKDQIAGQQNLVEERRKHANEYRQVMQSLGRDNELDRASFDTNIQWANGRLETLSQQHQQHIDHVYDLGRRHERRPDRCA